MHKSTCKLNHARFTGLGLEEETFRLVKWKIVGCPRQWQMMFFVATKCTVRADWCLSCMCCTYPTCADTGKLSCLPLVLHPPLTCRLWHFVCTCLIQKEGIYIISEKLYYWQEKGEALGLEEYPTPNPDFSLGPAASLDVLCCWALPSYLKPSKSRGYYAPMRNSRPRLSM